MPVVLVTGAGGTIGGATVAALRDLGVDPIVSGRHPEGDWPWDDLESRRIDFAAPETMQEGFAGVERVLLCSGHAPDLAALQAGAIEAARRAGVERIVKISGSPASMFEGTPAGVAAAHLEVEQILANSAVEHAVIRPNAFMSSILALFETCAAAERAIELPLGDAAFSLVDPLDVGRVAAELLLGDPLSRRIVEVTGPQALNLTEAAVGLREELGLAAGYCDTPTIAARYAMTELGFDDWTAAHTMETLELLRDRDGDRVTDDVQRVTGRAATGWREFLRRPK